MAALMATAVFALPSAAEPLLERDAGRLFLVSPAADADWEYWVREARVGGFVLVHGVHFSTPEELAQRCRIIRALADDDVSPPLVFARHEGGAFAALPSMLGATPDPGPLALAAAGIPAAAREAYGSAARDLRACGVDGVVGPRAGLYPPPLPPELQVRTFGAAPALAAALVSAAADGIREGGLLACMQGFPGGVMPLSGARETPLWNLTGPSREDVLAPFQALAAADTDMILVDHVRVPAWDDRNAAPISPAIVQGLLRDRLEFRGLIVASDMTLPAATERYPAERMAAMAIAAGCDLLRIDHAQRSDFEVRRDGILKFAGQPTLPEPRAVDAIARVQTRMQQAAQRRESIPAPGDIYAQLGRGGKPKAGLGVVLVRNAAAALPISAQQQDLLVVCPESAVELPHREHVEIGTTLGAKVRARVPGAREERYSLNPAPWEVRDILQAARSAKLIVLGVLFTQSFERQAPLAEALLALGKPTIIIGLGDPSDLEPFARADTLLLAGGFGEANLEAAAAVLFGEAKASGKLPLPIGELYPAGHKAAE